MGGNRSMKMEMPNVYRFDIQIQAVGLGKNSDEAFANALQSLHAHKWPDSAEISGEVIYSTQELVLPTPTKESN